MATPRLGLVVEDKPTELSCMYGVMQLQKLNLIMHFSEYNKINLLNFHACMGSCNCKN